jgi:hypothetical protein
MPPQRMCESRRGERQPGKSDEIDSLAIDRAVVKDGVECFPTAFLDERAMEIWLIADHRITGTVSSPSALGLRTGCGGI